MKIIGIDPGLSGAIAILENSKVLKIFDMPVMSEGKKNKRQLNSALLVNLLRENISDNEEISVVVEQVNAMPGQGVTSMFNFCLLYTSPSPRDKRQSRMPSSA